MVGDFCDVWALHKYPDNTLSVRSFLGMASVRKEEHMAFSVACKDAGMATCPGSFATETREELFAHLALHAAQQHPEMTMDDATKRHLDAVVKTI